MIQWMAPAALAGIALLLGPLLVHMLLRRRARRVVFPATRFLSATRAAAVRVRRPSDIALMLLRMAIVVAAVAAAAQPLLITPWRLAQWNGRVIRAVVVDAGRESEPGGEIARLAQQEMTGFRTQRFAGADLRDSLRRAASWFAIAPPGRREVVVLSDFRIGSIDEDAIRALPNEVGVRFIRSGTHPPSRDLTLADASGYRGGVWRPSMRVAQNGTSVTWVRTASARTPAWIETSQGPNDGAAAARALSAAASFGIAAGDDSQRVRVVFAGAAAERTDNRPLRAPWMVRAALALRRSALLDEVNAPVTMSDEQGRLVVETTIPASSSSAAAVLRAVMLAVRPESIATRDAEILAVSDAELAAWRREPGPAQPPAAGTVGESDGRWLWLLVLALLGVETWVRRSRADATPIEARHAA